MIPFPWLLLTVCPAQNSTTADVSLSSCSFLDVTSDLAGSALYLNNTARSFSIDSCVFARCTCTSVVAGVVCTTCSNGVFDRNTLCNCTLVRYSIYIDSHADLAFNCSQSFDCLLQFSHAYLMTADLTAAGCNFSTNVLSVRSVIRFEIDYTGTGQAKYFTIDGNNMSQMIVAEANVDGHGELQYQYHNYISNNGGSAGSYGFLYIRVASNAGNTVIFDHATIYGNTYGVVAFILAAASEVQFIDCAFQWSASDLAEASVQNCSFGISQKDIGSGGWEVCRNDTAQFTIPLLPSSTTFPIAFLAVLLVK